MLTDEVVDQIGGDENPLTRAEIEAIARRKGIELNEEEIEKIMKGDKSAVAVLNLTKEEKKEIAMKRGPKEV